MCYLHHFVAFCLFKGNSFLKCSVMHFCLQIPFIFLLCLLLAPEEVTEERRDLAMVVPKCPTTLESNYLSWTLFCFFSIQSRTWTFSFSLWACWAYFLETEAGGWQRTLVDPSASPKPPPTRLVLQLLCFCLAVVLSGSLTYRSDFSVCLSLSLCLFLFLSQY